MSKVAFEPTPNPATMKFLSPLFKVDSTFEFTHVNETVASPLAQKIFGFPWTSSVLIAPGFMTVTKQDWVDWQILAEPLANIIGEHLEQNLPLVSAAPRTASSSNTPLDTDPPLVRSIKQALEREIKPIVALDGGDVAYQDFQDGHLYLKMMGSCSGCPSSQITLKEGIEVRMKELFPEIREVHAL